MKKTYQHETSGNHRIEKEKDIKSLEDMVNEHRGRAKLSRHNYYRRRAKAVEPQFVKKGYLSMTIDAAGAQAANYSPRYSTTEKGEPARHHMLKMKSTYVKVLILVLLNLRIIYTRYIYVGAWSGGSGVDKLS